MTTVIGGSSPSITFSDSTTQSTAALPLTGGSLTGNITSTGSISSVNTFGFKNRIINGAMVIDQRNAGASQTLSATAPAAPYILDRWICEYSQASKLTVGQNLGSVTPPTGFTNYFGISVAATATIGSTDYFNPFQIIEGFNVADLGWGTANAKTITVSAWVYSNVTGTFGGSVYNFSGSPRSYPFNFTISSSNTWTQISVTIPGDTSGTWTKNNGAGLYLGFQLATGSSYQGTANTWSSAAYLAPTGATSIMGTIGNTFYFTGVQLEVGSTATSFDYRPYGTELQLCQRYFTVASGLAGFYYSGNGHLYSAVQFQVPMRTNPSASIQGTVSTDSYTGTTGTPSGAIGVSTGTVYGVECNVALSGSSGLTNGQYISVYGTTSNGGYGFSAEL